MSETSETIDVPMDKRAEMEAIMKAEREGCLAAVNAACESYHCVIVAVAHFGDATLPVGQVLAVPVSVQVASKQL